MNTRPNFYSRKFLNYSMKVTKNKYISSIMVFLKFTRMFPNIKLRFTLCFSFYFLRRNLCDWIASNNIVQECKRSRPCRNWNGMHHFWLNTQTFCRWRLTDHTINTQVAAVRKSGSKTRWLHSEKHIRNIMIK